MNGGTENLREESNLGNFLEPINLRDHHEALEFRGYATMDSQDFIVN
jgi:hypothetical protein